MKNTILVFTCLANHETTAWKRDEGETAPAFICPTCRKTGPLTLTKFAEELMAQDNDLGEPSLMFIAPDVEEERRYCNVNRGVAKTKKERNQLKKSVREYVERGNLLLLPITGEELASYQNARAGKLSIV